MTIFKCTAGIDTMEVDEQSASNAAIVMASHVFVHKHFQFLRVDVQHEDGKIEAFAVRIDYVAKRLDDD